VKAIIVVEQGGTENLIYTDMDDPVPGRGEVLVRVRAASLNRRDIFGREGSHGMRLDGPIILGLDIAGEVAQLGEGVTQFTQGQRVMGISRRGSYAQLTTAVVEELFPMPDWISFDEAACIPTVFATAWHMLLCRARLAIGETVLVIAGGSGVGSAAIQIAKRAGARVITTASSDEKLEKARSLGADEGINYKEFPDFSELALAMTDGQGVDIVFEHVGAAVWEQCFASLKRGGRFINCGVSAGSRAELHLGQLWTRDLSIMGTGMQPKEDLPKLMPLVERQEFRGVLHQTFPLEEAARAHEVLESSNFFGKLVLNPP